MTPLAQKLFRGALEAMKRFTPEQKALAGKSSLLTARCFEVTQVADLIEDLAYSSKFDPTTERVTSFLPAPVTWIERRYDWGRHGCLLHSPKLLQNNQFWDSLNKDDDLGGIAIKQFYSDARTGEVTHFPMLLMLFCDHGVIVAPMGKHEPTKATFEEGASDDAAGDARLIMAALAIINTPHIVGRREHQPHVGLQRDIARQQGAVGKFPMEEWTEILLEVTPPPVDGEGQGPRLTGHKALHFCRSFLRIRRGKLERVTGHWRGDPAIGVRRGRYTVLPPRQREVTHAV